MISLLSLPPLPYVIFELLRFRVKNLDNSKGPAESIQTVLMDVQPRVFRMGYSGRETYNSGLGDNNTRNVVGGNAPTKITLQGTFGQRLINRGLKLLDGYGRLMEFKELFIKSKSLSAVIKNNAPDEFRYIYGMNYYDFNHKEWGSIKLDTFEINSDAAVSNNTSSYVVNFTLFGELTDSDSKDPLVRNAKIGIAIQKRLKEANETLDKFVDSLNINLPLVGRVGTSTINDFLITQDQFSTALNATQIMFSEYTVNLGFGSGVNVNPNAILQGPTEVLSFAQLL